LQHSQKAYCGVGFWDWVWRTLGFEADMVLSFQFKVRGFGGVFLAEAEAEAAFAGGETGVAVEAPREWWEFGVVKYCEGFEVPPAEVAEGGRLG